MSFASAARGDETPEPALHDVAARDLRYIRRAMERAGSFTALSGVGYVLVGASAVAAAGLASQTSSTGAWVAVWLAELGVATALAVTATWIKARRLGVPLASGPARKLLLGFTPGMVAGGLLTAALVRAGASELLPGTWLAVYGASVVAGGLYSVPVVPVMGAIVLLLGAAGLALPLLPPDLLLGVGFGGVHLLIGVVIARRYGG